MLKKDDTVGKTLLIFHIYTSLNEIRDGAVTQNVLNGTVLLGVISENCGPNHFVHRQQYWHSEKQATASFSSFESPGFIFMFLISYAHKQSWKVLYAARCVWP